MTLLNMFIKSLPRLPIDTPLEHYDLRRYFQYDENNFFRLNPDLEWKRRDGKIVNDIFAMLNHPESRKMLDRGYRQVTISGFTENFNHPTLQREGYHILFSNLPPEENKITAWLDSQFLNTPFVGMRQRGGSILFYENGIIRINPISSLNIGRTIMGHRQIPLFFPGDNPKIDTLYFIASTFVRDDNDNYIPIVDVERGLTQTLLGPHYDIPYFRLKQQFNWDPDNPTHPRPHPNPPDPSDIYQPSKPSEPLPPEPTPLPEGPVPSLPQVPMDPPSLELPPITLNPSDLPERSPTPPEMDVRIPGETCNVRFFRNPTNYPNYAATITQAGGVYVASPLNLGQPTGHIDLQVPYDLLTSVNYMSIERGGFTMFCFIESFNHVRGNLLWRINYKVDALRTYRNRTTFGNQFILRSPQPSLLLDEMLGGTDPAPIISTQVRNFGNPHLRTMIVQTGITGAFKDSGVDVFSNAPGNPHHYLFYLTHYDARNPMGTQVIRNLFTAMADTNPSNIVSIYSTPFIPLDRTFNAPLFLNSSTSIGSFIDTTEPSFVVMMRGTTGRQFNENIVTQVTINVPTDITTRDHSIELLIPEAGFITVPLEVRRTGSFILRRDVDMFSGLVNYMLCHPDGTPSLTSIRGGGQNSIPIIGDAQQTYLSQNQNSLAVGVLRDTAQIVGGAAVAIKSGGLAAKAGLGMAASGAMGLLSRGAAVKDSASKVENPPAFLSSALMGNFSDIFYLIIKQTNVQNEVVVREQYGFPRETVEPLILPASGFVQTQNCSVITNGQVPMWAIDEINSRFDAGIRVI